MPILEKSDKGREHDTWQRHRALRKTPRFAITGRYKTFQSLENGPFFLLRVEEVAGRAMRILAFFLLIGLASAFHEEVNDADDLVTFFEELEKEHVAFAEQAEDETKTDLGHTLREGVDRVLQKIKEAVDEGREVRKELVDKLKELREKLRAIQEDISERSKQLLHDVKERARDYLSKLLDRLGLKKRSALDDSDLDVKDMLRKIREHLRNNVDPELLKEKIEKIFGQGREILRTFLRVLKEKGRRKLEILIDALLGDEEEEEARESRSIKEYWEKIKDYFKDLKIDLKEKYMKFGEWVKSVYDKGFEKSKDKFDNIRAIANEFVRHAKNVSKEVAEEAKSFFLQYKEELKEVWGSLQEKFDEIRNRKD